MENTSCITAAHIYDRTSFQVFLSFFYILICTEKQVHFISYSFSFPSSEFWDFWLNHSIIDYHRSMLYLKLQPNNNWLSRAGYPLPTSSQMAPSIFLLLPLATALSQVLIFPPTRLSCAPPAAFLLPLPALPPWLPLGLHPGAPGKTEVRPHAPYWPWVSTASPLSWFFGLLVLILWNHPCFPWCVWKRLYSPAFSCHAQLCPVSL